jgi:hypothetical protein
LWIASNIKQHGRVVDLQQRLRVFRLRPVQKAARGDLANTIQLLLGALKGFFLHDGLRDGRGKLAGFEGGQRRSKNFIGRAELSQDAGRQTGSQAGRERQRKPGEGSV